MRPTPSCLAVKKTEGRVGDQQPSVKFSVYELPTNIQDSRNVKYSDIFSGCETIIYSDLWRINTSWRPRFNIYNSNYLDILWAGNQLIVVVD